jgi:hypothetical protein
MSRENPYAEQLGTLDPLKVIATTPRRIEQIFEEMGSERASVPPAPGKWSAREILCHLADAEIAFSYRLRQILAEDHHTIQPWDQDPWAENYAAYDQQEALTTFNALRRWNVALVRTIPAEKQQKAAFHPERGELTFRSVLETMAGHDLNHLQQFEKIARDFAPSR